MYCKGCEYPLWGLSSRTCPECGRGFRPGEFEFTLNAVAFCCPHCDQHYYGTGTGGHLVPRTFRCVRCAATVDMDEMILRPTQGVREEQTRGVVSPWFDTHRSGFFARLFSTIGWSMGMPHKLMQGTPEEGSLGGSFKYFLIVTFLYTLVGTGLFAMFFVMMSMTAGGGGFANSLGMLFGSIGGTMAVFALFAVAWGLTTHLILRLTGTCDHGVGRTMQAILLTSGTNCTIAIPCLNIYFGWIGGIWWAVCATVAVIAAQGVSVWRGVLATLALPAVVTISGIALIVWGIIAMQNAMAGMGGFGAGMVNNDTADARAVGQAIITFSQNNDGAGPAHGLELLTGGYLEDGWAFVLSSSPTLPEMIPVGDRTLDDFALLEGEAQTDALITILGDMPPNVVAHRVGDFVFTHHGVDLADTRGQRGQLWLAVAVSDPDSRGTAIATWDPVQLIYADGTVGTVMHSTLDSMLQQQNTLRAREGLPPIPHPDDVLHGKPAVDEAD